MIGPGRGFVGMYLTQAVHMCFLTSKQFTGRVGMTIQHYIKTQMVIV